MNQVTLNTKELMNLMGAGVGVRSRANIVLTAQALVVFQGCLHWNMRSTHECFNSFSKGNPTLSNSDVQRIHPDPLPRGVGHKEGDSQFCCGVSPLFESEYVITRLLMGSEIVEKTYPL